MPYKMIQHLDLASGAEYDYAPWFKVPGRAESERRRCGRYRVLGVALTGHTRQRQIVYEGVTGEDSGLWFTCPLSDFAVKFLPVKKEEVAVVPATDPLHAPVEKTVDISERGSGY